MLNKSLFKRNKTIFLFLPEAVVPKAINKDEHGILVVSSFKSSLQTIENGNLNMFIYDKIKIRNFKSYLSGSRLDRF